jgi:hypothetical protein
MFKILALAALVMAVAIVGAMPEILRWIVIIYGVPLLVLVIFTVMIFLFLARLIFGKPSKP